MFLPLFVDVDTLKFHLLIWLLSKSIGSGFRLAVRPSSMGEDAGNGVFVESGGEVSAGQIVALYPGVVYQPYHPVLWVSNLKITHVKTVVSRHFKESRTLIKLLGTELSDLYWTFSFLGRFQSISNPYIFRCSDGTLIDGKFHGISGSIFNSIHGRDRINGIDPMCDKSWLLLPRVSLCLGCL